MEFKFKKDSNGFRNSKTPNKKRSGFQGMESISIHWNISDKYGILQVIFIVIFSVYLIIVSDSFTLKLYIIVFFSYPSA